MPKANRKCRVCGREYYVCCSCISIHSWKHLACSPECYRKLMTQDEISAEPLVIQHTEQEENRVLLRVKTKNKKTRNIIGYDIELGRFDCDDKTTLVFDDIDEFIIPTDEMRKISEIINECVNSKASE